MDQLSSVEDAPSSQDQDTFDRGIFAGLDQAENHLTPEKRTELAQALQGQETPAEIKARAINLSWASRQLKMDPDSLAASWDAVRDQIASSITGRETPETTDTQLYGLIGQRLEKAAKQRILLGSVDHHMAAAAMAGETDWLSAYREVQESLSKDAAYDPAEADNYRTRAGAVFAAAKVHAPQVGDLSEKLSSYFDGLARDGFTDALAADRNALLSRLESLPLPLRESVLAYAGARSARQIETSGHRTQGIESHVEHLERSVANMAASIGRTFQSTAAAAMVNTDGPFPHVHSPVEEGAKQAMTLRLRDTLNAGNTEAALDRTYQDVANRLPMEHWYQKMAYGAESMLPQMAPAIINPFAGAAILTLSMADNASQAYQRQGIDPQEAHVLGLVTGGVQAALMGITSKILSGATPEINQAFAKLLSEESAGFGSTIAKTLKVGALNTGIANLDQALIDATPDVVQSLASKFDESMPGVNWKESLDRLAKTRLDAALTLLPLVMVGTGHMVLQESPRTRALLHDSDAGAAIGIPESVMHEAANTPDMGHASLLIADAFKENHPADPEAAQRIAKRFAPAEFVGIQEGIPGSIPDFELWNLTEDVGEMPKGTTVDRATIESAGYELPKLKAERQTDGSYLVTDETGRVIDRATSAQEAAALLHEASLEPKPTQTLGAPEKAFLESISALPDAEGKTVGDRLKEEVDNSRKLGFAPSIPGADWIASAGRMAKRALQEFRSNPKFTAAKQAINAFTGKRQINSLEVRELYNGIRRVAKLGREREGITAWIQADGDRPTLERWYNASTMAARKAGYKAALDLSPQALQVAEHIRTLYAEKLKEAQSRGVIEDGIENYVNQVWEKEALAHLKPGAEFAGKLSEKFAFSKERVFANYFEGEQAGFKPVTKDIAKLVAIYVNELNKTIATRELVRDLTTKKATDGRPLAAPFGAASITEAQEVGNDAAMIRPSARPDDTMDFKTLPNPALSKWKWVTEFEGKPVMLHGQLGLHPEVFDNMKAILGKSALWTWYESEGNGVSAVAKALVQAIDKTNQVVKSTMLGGVSTFHAIHEAKRAMGNRINPFDLPELKPEDPVLQRAVKASLMLAGDNEAMSMFMEGLGSPSLIDRVPIIGQVSRAVAEFTFHNFIPRLKLKTWQALLERNSERFKEELASGKMKQADVDYLTSQQVNARFGHLNYADLGRDPTIRHLASIAALAPDFFESNLRNYGQVLQGLTGAKSGREPLMAFAATAAVVYVAARILNKLLDDDWHTEEPFAVMHGNRVYTMRNEVEDLWRMVKDPRRYAAGRESPLLGSLLDLMKGSNWRGERQAPFEAFKDFMAKTVPVSTRWIPGLSNLTQTGKNSPTSPFEQFLSSQGLQVGRHSVISDAYQIANRYKKLHGVLEDSGVYPTSKFQHLRYALEDGDAKEAAKAWDELTVDGADTGKLSRGFHSSLFHPFTGSKDMDEQMKATVQEDDLKTVEKAEASRLLIWARFMDMTEHHTAASAPTKDQ